MGAVGVEGGRVDHADALQQAKRLVALLVEQFVGRVVGGHGVGATDPLDEHGDLAGDVVGPLALAEARRLVHVHTLGLQFSDALGRTGDLAGRIDTHVGDVAGLRRLLDSNKS